MHEYRILRNGIRVVAEKIEYLRSVSIGVWVGNGSRNESVEENGISHFIEHMLFKGTLKRTAEEIAGTIDSYGGQINAFTAREYTCYYTKMLDTHADIAADVLSDIIFNSLLLEESVDLERRVIKEEINMYEDTPEELVYDLMYETVWRNTSMGRNILGTYDSLELINAQSMKNYLKYHYTAANIVISISGNYDDSFFDILEEFFGNQELIKESPYMPPAKYQAGNILRTKDIEQVQLVAAFDGIDVYDESVYDLLVFNNIFGSGMSSRLFQNIREKRGLVYSIGAGHSAYIGTGIFDISAAMSKESVWHVSELIADEINIIKKDKLTRTEVESAKEQLKGSYILSYESTGARMQGAGRSMLLNKPIYSQEDILNKINNVSINSVADIIDRIFEPSKLSIAVVGPIDNVDGLIGNKLI